MGKENNILTIDIGSRSVKMAEFSFQNGVILLTNFLSRRLERLENESPAECFERIYNEMLLEGGFTAKDVRLALPSSSSFQRLSKLPPMLGKSATVAKIIEYEAAQAVPYAMHEVEWGYQLLHHEWEETVKETDEEGNVSEVTTKNEEYEALFVAVKNEDVVCYTDAIERSGKKLLSVDLSALNLFNAAVVSMGSDDECTLLLEIGAKGSCLMIADHRRIFMRNIPIGGDTLNGQIAREFGVGDAEAEELKRRYGFVALGGAYDEPDSAIAATISKIARNVMTRLHGEISRSINVWRAQHSGNAPVKMLLAGGGSALQYTVEFFNEKLRIPVEYLNAFGLISISSGVDRNKLQAEASMAQAMIGMALHNVGTCPVDISLLPRAIQKQYILDARKPYFYASAMALISCLLISIVALVQVCNFEEERAGKVESAVKIAEAQVSSVNAKKGELDGHVSNYNQAAKYLDSRNSFGRVITALQEAIPNDRIWLVAIEPCPEEEDGSETEGEEGKAQDEKEKFSAVRKFTAQKFNQLLEVKKLRLVGYLVTTKADTEMNRAVLDEFRDAVNKSEIFEPSSFEIKFRDKDGDSNLTYFEVEVTLKEPLKK